MSRLLACDWGSTNLRAWVLDAGGEVLAQRNFPLGVQKLAPGEAARRFAEEVRPALQAQDLPALLCGAVGSNIGWTTVPYVDCPADLQHLAERITQVAPNVWIAPGVRCQLGEGESCVLRGEETIALGWIEQDLKRHRGDWLICQPGTHSMWLFMQDAKLKHFVGAFTGELYAVLSAHSILRSSGQGRDLAVFDEGLAAAGDGDALLNRLYTARSRVAGRGADQESTADYLSGLLIGAEVAATPGLLGLADAPVQLVGDAGLCERYERALKRRGTPVIRHEGEPAVRAGLLALAQMGGLL
ncbi:MAG TPA: 2-dehydro-3-deoxygalactonokinase [Phenylobacterium sp.]|nr:2-dehydro-3-deoxygalactonokinase [Phenylobacterium sp.]HQN49505.1 2-dehydro-3-deoxygalactonokinase [Phenylobacterium sp.]